MFHRAPTLGVGFNNTKAEHVAVKEVLPTLTSAPTPNVTIASTSISTMAGAIAQEKGKESEKGKQEKQGKQKEMQEDAADVMHIESVAESDSLED